MNLLPSAISELGPPPSCQKIGWKDPIAQIIVIIKPRRLERSCSAQRLQVVLSYQAELISGIRATNVRNSFASSKRNESCNHYVSRMQNVGPPTASPNPNRSYVMHAQNSI